MSRQEILRIKSIAIKNFRAYLGDSGPILFSRNNNSPVTIFHGTNGLGKTSLFNAIHWGIYGEEKKSKDHKVKSEGLVNSYVIDTLQDGDNDEMFVKIQIENQTNDLQYEITRKILIIKEGISKELVVNDIVGGKIPRSIVANTEITFAYKDPDSDDDELIVTSNQFTVSALLKKIFPKATSNFFLLDGELLDEFLNGNNVFVKKGIEDISQLPLLQNCEKQVKSTSNKVGASTTSNRTEYTLTEDKITKREEIKTKCEAQAPIIKKQIDELERKEAEGLKMILKYDDESIRKIQGQIESNKTSLTVLEENIKTNKKTIQRIVYDNLDKVIMRNAYQSAVTKYEQFQAEKKLPSKFSKDILQQLLNEHECVCGRNLNEDNEAVEKIKDMLSVSYDSTLGHSMNKIVDQTSDIVNELKNSEGQIAEIKKCNEQIADYRIKRQDLKNQNDEYETELDKVDSDKLEEIRKSNQDLSKKLKDARDERHENEGTLQMVTDELVTLRNKFDKIRRLTIKDEHAMNKIQLADYIQNILAKAHEQLRSEFVEIVKEKTEELYMKTAPQAHIFHGISIDKNTFAIEANRSDGKDKEISRGQAHVLGISFINAIRHITTKNYFMIIDSPFHNISQQERIDICDEIPTSHENTQLTLLVTDSEYEGDVKKTNLPSVRSTLKKNDSIGCEYNLVQKPHAKIKSEEYFKTNVEEYS